MERIMFSWIFAGCVRRVVVILSLITLICIVPFLIPERHLKPKDVRIPHHYGDLMVFADIDSAISEILKGDNH